jgi:hypothetical protein
MKAALTKKDEARQELRRAQQKIIEQQNIAEKANKYAQTLLENLSVYEERFRSADEAVIALIMRWRAEAKAITDARPPESNEGK